MTCLAQLNQRLDVLAPQRVSDNVGGAEVSWLLIATLWASISPRHKSEKLTAKKLAAQTTHKITIRYRDDIKPDMRFALGVREFEILSIININEANTWLECLCVEGSL